MEREHVVELLDEDNQIVRFEHLMTLEHEGEDYVLLSPLDDLVEAEDGDVIIMRIENQDDQDVYVGIEDDELLETIFQKYLEIVENDEE